jgi:Calx-beta domain/RTX calcium-binding nonapeptide repeat (4 copies)/Bacterial Ig-like domain
VSVDGGTTWIDATASSGSWSAAVTLAGSGNITTRTIDAAGNTTAGSSQAYTLDTTAPAASASITGLSADTGTSNSDFITSVASQTVSGSFTGTLGSGEKLQVSVDGGTTWIDATAGSGTWSAGVTLLSGNGNITTRTIDAAGNTTAGASQAYTLDTTAPTAGNLSLNDFTGDGDNTFDLSLAGNEAGSTVAYQISTNGGTNWATTTAAQSGLANGSYQFRAVVTDAAGNTSTSNAQSITIDSTLPTISIDDITVIEGATGITTATVTVRLSKSWGQSVSVGYATEAGAATAGADYTTTSGTLTFSSGDTIKTFTVDILNDNLNEQDEAFNIILSNPTGATIGDSTGVVTITDTRSAAVTTILDADVENLTLTGSGNIDGTGNAAANKITGNNGNNILNGGAGGDTINGGAGNDTIVGFDAGDSVNGGADTDTLVITATSLDLNNAGNAQLVGIEIIDATGATAGVNLNLTNQTEGFEVDGGNFADTITGGDGNDYLYGFNANDQVMGGNGNDTVDGGIGNDSLTGGEGTDLLLGGEGTDRLIGGNGNDILVGGVGQDALYGNAGADRFSFNFGDSLLSAPDRVWDFNQTEGDRFEIAAPVNNFFNAGLMAGANLAAAVVAAYADKDQVTAGGQALAANEVVMFRYGTRTYLAVNNGSAAFDASNDLVIEMTSAVLATGDSTRGSLSVGNYFVAGA